MRESPSFLVPRGIIAPNRRPMGVLRTFTRLGRRRVLRPQNVSAQSRFLSRSV